MRIIEMKNGGKDRVYYKEIFIKIAILSAVTWPVKQKQWMN